MMLNKMKAFALLAICSLAISSCGSDDDSDKNFAPIVGVWQGTHIDYKFSPSGAGIGYSDSEDFDGVVEFKDDGTVIYKQGGDESSGTYTVTGDKLTTTVEFTSTLPFSTSTFTIKKLTQSELRLYFEDSGEFDVPDFGTIEGDLEATVSFERQ
jgi:uncharacterized protein (TIGR03066 family)